MLDKLKSIYDKIPKNNLRFLKRIPDRLLFGKSYGEYIEKILFDSIVFDKDIFRF